jgi:hypothetical protein
MGSGILTSRAGCNGSSPSAFFLGGGGGGANLEKAVALPVGSPGPSKEVLGQFK